MIDRSLLEPYRAGRDGPFGYDEAAHLLARTGFGASDAEITETANGGLDAALDRVFSKTTTKTYDRVLGMGARLARRDDIEGLQAQWLLRMLTCPHPLREHVALFWHDHFATAHRKVGDTIAMFDQNRLFLEGGLGPFPELLEAVARDPAMLVWLDNATSSRHAPNENFARELFELFSLGRGRYTEKDIRETARAFTGWHVVRGRFRFMRDAHDAGMKTVFGTKGRHGGHEVLALTTARDDCAAFIARKLARWFVTTDVPDDLARRLGAMLRAEGLDIGRYLRRLLASRLFFHERSRKRLIKSPVQLVVGALRSLEARADTRHLARLTARLGQALYDPPSVNGWDGGRHWINSASMIGRQNFGQEVGAGGKSDLGCVIGLRDTRPEGVVNALLAERTPEELLGKLVKDAGGDAARLAAATLALPRAQLT